MWFVPLSEQPSQWYLAWLFWIFPPSITTITIMSDFFSLSTKKQQNILRMYERLNNIKLTSSQNNLSLEDRMMMTRTFSFSCDHSTAASICWFYTLTAGNWWIHYWWRHCMFLSHWLTIEYRKRVKIKEDTPSLQGEEEAWL